MGKGTVGEQTTFTVSQDGTGDFTSIQAAIDASKAFPDRRVIIFIRKGIYREKIRIPACNTRMSMIGESAENTVITWDTRIHYMLPGKTAGNISEIVLSKVPLILFLAQPRHCLNVAPYTVSAIHTSRRPVPRRANLSVLFSGSVNLLQPRVLQRSSWAAPGGMMQKPFS